MTEIKHAHAQWKCASDDFPNRWLAHI